MTFYVGEINTEIKQARIAVFTAKVHKGDAKGLNIQALCWWMSLVPAGW